MPTWLREPWDRLVASDPGLTRLRLAVGGALSMVTALGVELVAARLLGAGGKASLLLMMLGGIVAMMGSMVLTGVGPGTWVKVRTAVFFPVAFGIGLTLGTLAHVDTRLTLAVFVVISFSAVFVRRFGIPFFFYGFMAWIGYMISTLLGATPVMLPIMLLGLVIGTAWVLLLSLTVLRDNPTRTLRRTLRAFHARVRTVAAVCADLAAVDVTDERELRRWQARLHAHQRRLTEAALMIEALSGQQPLPSARAGERLRNHALDTQLALDSLAGSVEAIARSAPALAARAAAVAAGVARRDAEGARRAVDELRAAVADSPRMEAEVWWPVYRLTEAVAEFAAVGERDPDRGEDDEDDESGESTDFRSAVELMMGNLPSAAGLARDVAPRGPRWLLERMSMNTRQSLQVAVAASLAVVAGSLLSPGRYYWALIAVFVTFTGTATRAESVRKALYRLIGTLLGLAVAMVLAHLTAGDPVLTLAVIVVSLFCGFYLLRVSYAMMIFFITIMVGQLYTVLGRYSDHVLVLRLEETAIGAVIGIVVALAFLPLSTRDTVRAARDRVLETLALTMETAAARIDGAETPLVPAHGDDTEGEERPPELEELTRQLDDGVRQLVLVATPFSRPAMWGSAGRHLRYRLTRYGAIADNVRALTVGLRRSPVTDEPTLAEVARSLAETARGLTAKGDTARVPSGDGWERISERLHARMPDEPPPLHYEVTRPLLQISDLLAEISPSIMEGRVRSPEPEGSRAR